MTRLEMSKSMRHDNGFLRTIATFLAVSILWIGAAVGQDLEVQWLQGTQWHDNNGNPLEGATVTIQEAGTTTPRLTYSDADGTVPNPNPITLDSAGRFPVSVYNPTGRWKFVLAHPRYNLTVDDILGALDTSQFGTGSGAVDVPIIAKTGDYTVVADDLGKCIVADPTGGAFRVTLISASTAGDGKTICVRHAGTANQVTVASVSNQRIYHFDTPTALDRLTWILTVRNQGIWMVSDGANWHVLATPWDMNQHKFGVQDDDLSAPPPTPLPGAYYIVGSSPTGAWSTYSPGDIAQATGLGTWFRIVPSEGWKAYIFDENSEAFFNGAVWQLLPTGRAPAGYISGMEIANNGSSPLTAIDLATGIARDSNDFLDIRLTAALTNKLITSTWSAGNNGGLLDQGSVAANTWYHVFAILNPVSGTVDALACLTFEFTGCAQPSGFTAARRVGSIKTEAGNTNIRAFFMKGDSVLWSSPTLDVNDAATGTTAKTGAANVPTGLNVLALLNATISRTNGISVYISSLSSADLAPSSTVAPLSTANIFDGTLSIQASVMTDTSGQFRYRTNSSDTLRVSTLGWREPRRSAGTQGPAGPAGADGPAGATGPAGADGLAGLNYNFSTTQVMADPGPGNFRLNDSIGAATQLAISHNTSDTGNPDYSGYFATWNTGDLRISLASASENFGTYTVASCVHNVGWSNCTMAVTANSGSIPDASAIKVEFIPAGPAGATGDPGPTTAVTWAFNSDTTATPTDPGNGRYRFNAAPNLATLVWFSNEEVGGNDMTAWLDSWGTRGDTNNRGTLTIVDPADSTKVYVYRVEGGVIDRTGYREVTIAFLSGGGALVNLEPQAHTFAATGQAGSGLSALIDDPTPTLGGDLRVGNFKITDVPARPLIGFAKDASAVNYLVVGNAATGAAPTISPEGTDTNVDLIFSAKGSGKVEVKSELTVGANDLTATNAGSIKENGISISPIGAQTIWIPAGALLARATDGSTPGTFETTTHQINVSTQDFEDAAAKYAQVQIQMPKGWNASTITAQFVWIATATTGNVLWGVQGVCMGDNTALDVAMGGEQDVTDGAGSGANNVMISPVTAAMTFAGSPAAEQLCMVQVHRDAALAGDTMTGDARLLGVRLHYTLDAANDN